ncbi:MAG: acetyl-CoA carboxylase carboxyltransferase subunit alpha [Deltaproteobacteria bacterium]|nr:acetyl-CoA carboxylase carboxyltransferase subunit alpha [Candidatus Zymogenaceae bacterium]
MVENGAKFERSIGELYRKIRAIKNASGGQPNLEISKSLEKLQAQAERLELDYFDKMDRWKKVEISRHEKRPQMLDYISLAFDDFIELKGDRLFGDDPAVVGGFGTFHNVRVVVIGNQKGRGLKERMKRNFGMPHPEGYRKAQRLMELAQRFCLPLITMVDTPGAYPGVEAEERGQSEAIARTMAILSMLKTPIITVVLGEGGSGGALALAVGDRILMMEHANYSVVSPEGCASILWKDHTMKRKAAEALKSTAQDNFAFGLIDEIIPEPHGGAHRDHAAAAQSLNGAVQRHLSQLMKVPVDRLVDARYERFRKIGVFNS